MIARGAMVVLGAVLVAAGLAVFSPRLRHRLAVAHRGRRHPDRGGRLRSDALPLRVSREEPRSDWPGRREPERPEARFRPTDEVFVDPTTHQKMRVYADSATGERRYVAEG
jgi:hypothetical protein